MRQEPIDLYHVHDYFTVSPDEPEDDVANANENVGIEFGYGRPDVGEFELEDEEFRETLGEFLEEAWPIDRSLRAGVIEEAGEDWRDFEDEGEGDDEGEAEGESAEQRVDGDETTNTDTAVAVEEDGTNTNVDTPMAPAAEGESPTRRVPGSITTDDAVSRAPEARID